MKLQTVELQTVLCKILPRRLFLTYRRAMYKSFINLVPLLPHRERKKTMASGPQTPETTSRDRACPQVGIIKQNVTTNVVVMIPFIVLTNVMAYIQSDNETFAVTRG